MDSQDKVLDKSRELWEEFMKIPSNELHPDDINDFRHHLHALQNMMYAQKYLKRNVVSVEITGKSLVARVNNRLKKRC